MSSFIFLAFWFLTLVIHISHATTTNTYLEIPPSKSDNVKNTPSLLTGDGNVQNILEELLSQLTKNVKHLKPSEDIMENKIGVGRGLSELFIKVATNVKEMQRKTQDKSIIVSSKPQYNKKKLRKENEHMIENSEISSADLFNNKLLEIAMGVLTGNTEIMNSFIKSPTVNIPADIANMNSTYDNIWMIIKSTWQRLLAYVEDENSLETFMQNIPVKIIDSVINLGDELNLMNFLAKKLDKDLAEFLASEINPLIGPLKDFDTFYNFTKEHGLGGVIDYFTSDKFTYTMNIMSKVVSGYLEDTVSDDLVNQYIEFISFNNTDLLNFYKSVLRSQGNTFEHSNEADIGNHNKTLRIKRNVLEHIASSYVNKPVSIQRGLPENDMGSGRQMAQRFGQMNTMALPSNYYDPSRDGGYGGGGYGGGGYGMNMSTLDPYVVLGALALGTILGFLLFRALRGTAGGRRDIGDGSLSLWDSDLPDQILPWGSSVEHMKRQVDDNTHSFSLPLSLRGDVWSSDPLVADNLLDDHFDEDDIANHLNHLWHLYRDTNETTCVHSHLCHVMANTTANHLTGKDSSLALIMASLGNLVGVAGSGQLVDEVSGSLVLGSPFTCPDFTRCHGI